MNNGAIAAPPVGSVGRVDSARDDSQTEAPAARAELVPIKRMPGRELAGLESIPPTGRATTFALSRKDENLPVRRLDNVVVIRQGSALPANAGVESSWARPLRTRPIEPDVTPEVLEAEAFNRDAMDMEAASMAARERLMVAGAFAEVIKAAGEAIRSGT